MNLKLINIKIKRFLAVLLAVVMLLGITPMPALAEQDPLSVEGEISFNDGQGNPEESEDHNDFDDSMDSEKPEDPGDLTDPESLNDPGTPGDPDELLEKILTLTEADADIGGGDNNGGNELPDFGDADFAQDQIIIVFEDAVANVFSQTRASEDLIQETLEEGLAELPGELDDVVQLDGGAEIIATVELPDDMTVGEAILEYEQNPLVEYAQPNFIYHLQTDRVSIEFNPQALGEDIVGFSSNVSFPLSTAWRPNDPLVNMVNPLASASHLDRIGAFEAWELLHPLARSKVTVAVIDTQIQMDHPDLIGRLRADLAVNIQSKNWNNESAWHTLDPPDYHGTHVAGLIGATSNNGLGSAGVAAGRTNNIVEIIPINVFEWDGSKSDYVSSSTISSVRAIDYALRSEVGAQVINMSLGGEGNDYLFEAAVTRAYNAGTVVVVAAGNTGDTRAMYPSDYTRTISVINAVHTANGWMHNTIYWPPQSWVEWRIGINPRNDGSSWGPQKNMSAPGSFIWSTVPTDLPGTKYTVGSSFNTHHQGYDIANGTSMASPVVAGVAALVLFADPSLTPAQVTDILYQTATDVHVSGKDDQTGHGVVNAEEAVKRALRSNIVLDKSGTFIFAPATFGYGAQTAETVTVTNTGNQATGALSVALSGTNASSFTLSRTSIPSIAVDGDATFTVVPKTGLAVGTYTATVTVSRATSNTNNITARNFTVRFVVGRAPGAAVSGVPVVSGTPAHNSITVAAVTNAGGNGQAVQYAINQDQYNAPETGWQSGRTFSGLTHSNEYYVWARTAENANYLAGEPQRSAVIVTALGDFDIVLNRLGVHSFGAAAIGYSPRGTVSVTVTNTGNQATGPLTVALSGGDTDKFEFVAPASLHETPPAFAGIAAGGTRNFTIKPIDGLAVGSYRATVTVSGNNVHFGDFSATFDVAFTVNRVAGAAVSGVPKMQNRTHNSITVGAVTIPTNPGSQTIEYAISRTTTAPGSGWQSERTFNNLLPSTTYYVYARTAAIGDYNAGAIQRSAIISTLAPSHAITLNRSGTRTLSAANFGYNAAAATQRAESVTVKNTGSSATGTLRVELSGKDASKFVLSANSLSTIAAGNSRSFTVRPGIGLLAGTYTATVTVSNANVPAQSYNVTFTVNRGAGFALSAAPAVTSRTSDSITVNVPVISGKNPGEQTVQYAITTSTASTMPTNLVWQGSPTFTGLRPTTAYRVWARTAVNNNCNAGTARRSAEITTLTPEHSVEIRNGNTILTRTGLHTFSAANFNYTAANARDRRLTVTVRNNGSLKQETGELTVSLTGPDTASFTLSTDPNTNVQTLSLDNIIAGGTARTFTVVPKHGLASGVYTAMVEVRNEDDLLLGSFNIRFTVNKIAGATINAVPKVARRTPHSITVNAVTSTNIARSPDVQYAITTSASTTMPSNLVWQDSPTFTGLRAMTTYRVWARTTASFNYNAGTARCSAAIQTGGITLNRTTLQTFAARTFTNNARSPLSVTITNKGSQPIGPLTIALSGAQAGSFTTSVTTIGSIAGGKTATFTVTPRTGIGVRTHNATVTVSGTDGATFSAKFNVRIVVSRGTGSALNAAPSMGSRTHNSITVKTLNPSGANPGGQAVQYAITTSTATKMPTNLKWQASPTFTGLLRSTKYYVWARTAQNSNCSAGTARRSAAITTLAPANAVTLNRVGTYTFAAAGFNYGARSALSVKVTNAGTNATGVLAINLSGADPGSFEIVSPAGTTPARTLASIAKGGNRSFTIRPKQGLAVSDTPYTAIVTVSGANGISQIFNVSFRVNKAAGAATSNVPVASEVTANSITVSPVTVPTNPGKQAVKYAISTSSSTTAAALAGMIWQDGTTFDGLNPSTTYYVFTRTEENATHNAGAVRRSAAIKTDAPDRSISLNRSGTHNFAAAAYGYGTRPSLLVTVNNTGRQNTGDLTITLSNPAAFEVVSPATPELAGIAVGGNRSFTIRPVTGLDAGQHTATVTVSGEAGIVERSFDVSFTVNKAAGAVVSGAPTVAVREHDSITVNAVKVSTNPGGQDVEYAISTSSSTTAAALRGLDWQSELTFIDLAQSTVYYVFARTAESGNHNAGAVQRAVTFTIAAPELPEPPEP